MVSDIGEIFLNAALTGKDVNPDQLIASMYGDMGGIFGRGQGPVGAFASTVREPLPPTAPKALRFTIPRLLRA